MTPCIVNIFFQWAYTSTNVVRGIYRVVCFSHLPEDLFYYLGSTAFYLKTFPVDVCFLTLGRKQWMAVPDANWSHLDYSGIDSVTIQRVHLSQCSKCTIHPVFQDIIFLVVVLSIQLNSYVDT